MSALLSAIVSCCAPLPVLFRPRTTQPSEELATLMPPAPAPTPAGPHACLRLADPAVQIFFDGAHLHRVVSATEGLRAGVGAGVQSIPHQFVYHIDFLGGGDGVVAVRIVYDARCLGREGARRTGRHKGKSGGLPKPLAAFEEVVHADVFRDERRRWLDAARRLAYPSTASSSSLLDKRALVFVNPHSGRSRGLHVWNSIALPIFQNSHVRIVRTEVTTHTGHAEDLARAIDPDEVDVVVVCSGDGLVYEVVNGLAQNMRCGAQGEALRRVSVAHVPCGTGNAFARTFYGTTNPRDAALEIVKGAADVPMDLMSITQRCRQPAKSSAPESSGSSSSSSASGGSRQLLNNAGAPRRTFAFLSIALGLIARADLDTEWARRVGEVRIAAGVVGYGFGTYPARVWIKPVVEGREALEGHYERERWRPGGLGGAKIGEEIGEEVRDGDGGEGGRDQGGEVDRGEAEPEEVLGLPPLRHGTVDDPLEAHGPWYELDNTDRLSTVYCGNIPWVSGSDHVFPLALPSDGLIDLIWLHRPRTTGLPALPGRLIRLSAGVVDQAATHYCKIAAMRVEPSPAAGAISVDGERWPLEALQVECHRGLGRVVAGRRRGIWGAVDVLGQEGAGGEMSKRGDKDKNKTMGEWGVKRWVGGEYVPTQRLAVAGKKRKAADDLDVDLDLELGLDVGGGKGGHHGLVARASKKMRDGAQGGVGSGGGVV